MSPRVSKGEPSTFALSLAGATLVELVDAPEPVLEVAGDLQGGRPTTPAGSPAVQVRFAAPGGTGELARGADGDVRAALAADGRFFLADEWGALAQLPIDGDETALYVDPAFDTAWVASYLLELVRWRASAHGAVMMHACAVVMPEGGVVLSSGEGIGKTASVLALLEEATALLADDRVMLTAAGEASALTFEVKLKPGRRYALSRRAARAGLRWRQRTLVRGLPVVRRLSPPPVRTWLDRRYDGFVGFDVARAFPGVEFLASATVRIVAFLERGAGSAVELTPLDRVGLLDRVAAAVRYWHDDLAAACDRIYRAVGGGPARPAFVVLDDCLAHLPRLLDGVDGWVLRLGPRTRPADLVAAVRTAVTSAPA